MAALRATGTDFGLAIFSRISGAREAIEGAARDGSSEEAERGGTRRPYPATMVGAFAAQPSVMPGIEEQGMVELRLFFRFGLRCYWWRGVVSLVA
jgi:hypothetical protein